MKNILLLCFFCFAAAVTAQTRLNSATPKLFIENKGQITDKNGLPQPDIHFVLKDRHVNVFIGPQGIHYLFSKTAYSSVKQDKDSVIISTYRMQMHLTGTNPMSQLIRGNKNDYYENYYNVIGRPEGIPHVPTFEKITYKNIYPNIDWQLYIVNEQLKYDFIIHPGGDVKNISIEYINASDARINSDGSLTVTNPLGEINESAPVSWMGKNKTPLQHKYKLVKKENRYEVEFTGVENGSSVYETNADITIDPIVQWRSYYGGLSTDILYATRTDNDDNVLFAGGSRSTNNISTTNAWQSSRSGVALHDGMLIKMTATGIRIWATYYGGEWDDIIFCLAIDHENKIVIGGVTQSTVNIASTIAYQSTRPTGSNTQGFIAKLTTSGYREWGTYYGSDQTYIQYVTSLAIDRVGNIYLMGLTGNGNNQYAGAMPGYFSHNSNPNINSPVVYIARFTPQGLRLWGALYGKEVFSPTFSYATATTFTSITTDWDGNIYFCGSTTSTDSTSFCKNAFQNSKSGAAGYYDGFIAKFKPNGQWVWGTYFGGTLHEYLYSIGLDNNANVYVGGRTTSTQMNYNGWSTSGPGVFARFDSSGSRIWTTHGWWGEVKSLDVDKRNIMFYSMQATQTQNGSYWGRFTPNAQLLNEPSTTQNFIVHGASVDGNGNAYFCGRTADTTISISGGHQNTYGGDAWDGFIMKMLYDTTFRISRPKFAKNEMCRGDSIWVRYNVLSPLYAGNTLTVELSDVNGVFINPIKLAIKSYTASIKADSLRILLPANLTPASSYRIRIINTNPGDTSSPSAFFKVQQPVANILNILNGGSTQVCQGNFLWLSGVNASGIRYQWQRNGTNTSFLDTLFNYKAFTTGTYRVISTTSGGCVTTSKDTLVTFYPNPVSDIRINSTTQQCLPGNLFQFADSSKISVGNIASRTWIWTDSVSAFSADTQRVFNTHGIYGVSLLVTTDIGCKDSSYKTVEVFAAPFAKLKASSSNEQCIKGHSFSFADSSSITAGSYTRLWNFGDATTDTTVQKNKSYAVAGSYSVKLNITSDKGCKDSANTSVTVHPQPVAGYSANTTEQCHKGHIFLLNDTSVVSTGNINTRSWTLGDGNLSALQLINKTYAFSGTYPVTLVVTSDKGCKDSTGKILRVNPHPQTLFNVSNNTQCLIGNAFTFTNQSILPGGIIQGYKWQFGNGDSSNVSAPVYQYPSAGNYTVQLVATSSKNCSDTLVKSVRINPHPAKPVISRNLFVLSSSTAPSYQWLLNNNSISGATTKDYTVTANGYYQVVVTDTTTCSSRSDSVAVLNVGTNELLSENIHLYPNPNNGTFTLELPPSNQPYRVEIFNTNGQVVYSTLTDETVVTPNKQLKKGVYLLRIIHAHESKVVKVVVE